MNLSVIGEVQLIRHLQWTVRDIGKLERVQCAGEAGFDMAHDKSLKALHNTWNECYRMIIVQIGYSRFLQDRNYSGSFET